MTSHGESSDEGESMSVSDIASVVTAAVAVFAALGAYIQYVLKRTLLPSIEFDVDFDTLTYWGPHVVGEVSLVVKNVGSSMLIVTNLRFKGRYHIAGGAADSWPKDPTEPLLPGRVPVAKHNWAPVLLERTFVQPSVTQNYRRPVLLPSSATVINILGSLDYRIEIGPVTRTLVRLFARPPKDIDWRKGITGHTARRTFHIPAADTAPTPNPV
jgi:hypothetical protein